jgi:hypothetical protein
MQFTQPTFVIVLFVVVRSADLAITYGMSRSWIRAICYGVVALLALIAAIMLLGIH